MSLLMYLGMLSCVKLLFPRSHCVEPGGCAEWFASVQEQLTARLEAYTWKVLGRASPM